MTTWHKIPADHPSLPGHFPGTPIVPGVVLLSYIWQAVCDQAGQLLRCLGWPNVKFLAPLRPEESFAVMVEFSASGSAKFVCKSGEQIIAQGSVRYAVEGEA